ncbi:MAG TPA: hypothetical protein VG965_02650 [Patescibacteria group bacterium]|nr:hypothetical protein [Patescibacteria group bacterium]
MEEFIAKLDWKKLAAGLVVIGIIIILFIVFATPKQSIPSQDTQTQQIDSSSQDQTSTNSNTGGSSLPKIGSSPAPASTSGWSKFSGKSFSLSYPPNYAPQQGTLDGGYESLVLSSGSKNTKINIATYDSASGAKDRMSKLFSAMRYQNSQTTVSGLSANEFKGSVTVSNQTIQDDAVILEVNGIVYKIQLSYDSPGVDQSIESVFEGVLSSFELAGK